MKTKILLILSLGLLTLQSCVREDIHHHDPYVSADVYYDYWTGPSGTIIDGEVYNEGNTFIREVEVEVRMYDGNALIYKEWFWIDVDVAPGEVSYFSLDIFEPYVDDVDVRITQYD